jgi:hypothetical protein
MHLKKNIQKFTRSFLHPRVFIFVIMGTAIIFLTFLTENNALEIAISGIASVFIGIGVNNYSLVESRDKEEQKLKGKINNAIKLLELLHNRVCQNMVHLHNGDHHLAGSELKELEKLIKVSIELLQEDSLLP